MASAAEQRELVVGFHGECLDGSVAAWAAFRRFGERAEYLPLLHRDPPPTGLRGREVVLVDFAFPVAVLNQFRARTVTVLDHHDTHLEQLRGTPGVLIDLDRSGAGISWDQLHMSAPRPRLVDYTEDDDLGRWRLPSSKEVRCYLGMVHADTQPRDFATWQRVADEMQSAAGFTRIVEQGRCMLAQKIADVHRIVEQSGQMVRFRGALIPAVNSVNSVDEICDLYGREHPFVIVWHGIAGGRYKYSLRTLREDVHVGQIAASLGGGGRPRAGAFYSERPLLELPGVTQA